MSKPKSSKRRESEEAPEVSPEFLAVLPHRGDGAEGPSEDRARGVAFVAGNAWSGLSGKRLARATDANPLLNQGSSRGGGIDDASCLEVEEIDASVYLKALRAPVTQDKAGHATAAEAAVAAPGGKDSKATKQPSEKAKKAEKRNKASSAGRVVSLGGSSRQGAASGEGKKQKTHPAEAGCSASAASAASASAAATAAAAAVAEAKKQLSMLKALRKAGSLDEASFSDQKTGLLRAMEASRKAAAKAAAKRAAGKDDGKKATPAPTPASQAAKPQEPKQEQKKQKKQRTEVAHAGGSAEAATPAAPVDPEEAAATAAATAAAKAAKKREKERRRLTSLKKKKIAKALLDGGNGGATGGDEVDGGGGQGSALAVGKAKKRLLKKAKAAAGAASAGGGGGAAGKAASFAAFSCPAAWAPLGLHDLLGAALGAKGFSAPTPIQRAVLPAALGTVKVYTHHKKLIKVTHSSRAGNCSFQASCILKRENAPPSMSYCLTFCT